MLSICYKKKNEKKIMLYKNEIISAKVNKKLEKFRNRKIYLLFA